MTAQIQGKLDAWDAAVKQAREEYRAQGTENPNDQTKGYVDRINEIYEGFTGEKALAKGAWQPEEHPRGDGGRFAEAGSTAAKQELPTITGVSPIAVDSKNYGEVAKREFKKLRDKIRAGLYCQALDNRPVVGTKAKHLKQSRGRRRNPEDIIRRVGLMPFVVPIIEQGILAEKREGEKGVSYEISGHTPTGKTSVILTEEKESKLLYLSVFDENKNVVNKSLSLVGGSTIGSIRRFPFMPWGQELISPNHDLIIPDISDKSICF
jgi:hypothetical protein